MRRFGAPIALVLAAAAVAGCGGGGSSSSAEGVPAGTGAEAPVEGVDAYVEQVRAADGTIRGTTERLTAGTTAAELEEILVDLEDAVRRVEQATPPYDLLPQHQILTQSLWGAVDEGYGLTGGETAVTAAGLSALVDALNEAAAALDEMEEKGYEVRRRT
jgi:hypothetical protein